MNSAVSKCWVPKLKFKLEEKVDDHELKHILDIMSREYLVSGD